MAKKRRRKLRTEVKRAMLYILVFVIVGIYAINESIKIYKEEQYKKTDEYKLIEIGYEKEKAEYIIDNTNEEIVNYLKTNNYNETYYDIISSKYYLNKNFEAYVQYQELHEKEEIDLIIALVNTNAASGWYNKEIDTDITKGDLILVNKFYHLNKEFERDDLVKAQLSYAYADNEAAEKVLLAFKDMKADVEEKLGVRLMINSSYRSYETQEEIYNEFKKVSLKYADSYAARPGYSEHQTGLAIDITSLEHPNAKVFSESEEYEWLKNNCYKYGFILRYPENKENITGYSTESWHFRYVGEIAAKKIHDENITFDEYYAYYVEGDK